MADLPSASSAADTNVSLVPAASGGNLYVMKRTFDLDDLLSAKIADGDVVNLFTIPADHVILSCQLEVTVAQVGGTGTCTLTVGDGTDTYVAATSMSTAGTTTGPTTATFPQPIETACYLELTAAVGGGTLTTNPTVQITLIGIDCSS